MGPHSARFAHLTAATQWVEVRADSWADATAKVREGEGTKITAPEKGKKTPRARKGSGKGKGKGKAAKAEAAPQEITPDTAEDAA